MDVLAATKIDINVLGRIVASSGATIDSFESFFAKHEHHEQTMLDIGILRYPDIDHPYFKVRQNWKYSSLANVYTLTLRRYTASN